MWCRGLSLISLDSFATRMIHHLNVNLLTGHIYRILCTKWANLQLICLGWSWLQGSYLFISNLLVAQATKMTKFMAIFTLVFACWTSKSFKCLESPHFLIFPGLCVLDDYYIFFVYLLCNIACDSTHGNTACLYLALV